MDLLKCPVTALSGVGPKYKTLLEKLEIRTVQDLLYHVPFRYDDYSNIKIISELQGNEVATISAVLGPVTNIFTRGGKKLTRASVADHSGKVDLIWFNQHYLKSVLKPGGKYLVSGKLSLFDKKLCFIAPEMEIVGESGSLHTGRLVPIYPETAGVSSKWFRIRINDVLSKNLGLQDLVPENISTRLELKPLVWSLENIHFPNSLPEADLARRRLAFDELFTELLRVEIRKNDWTSKLRGHVLKPLTKEVEKFVQSLPFKLTDSQKQAAAEIAADMSKPHPMNRLLEGDVGTGKTVVAIISAYHAHINGYKTIYLAPTEILAQQHYQTFTNFLEKTKIKVALLTHSQKDELESADIVIGTHALLYKDDLYQNVALMVIDEQHRFGVEQRGKLLELGKSGKTPHLLTMSATPIPRTLALTLYGDLALSTLKTHPKSTRKVVTKVAPETQREEIYNWIKQKDQPTFIVCPFIEESENESLENVKAAEKEFASLQKGTLKGVKLGLIHGRMKSEEKQKVITDFREGKIKVLVATPVIEVGIDIPDATIIVIEGAERYGLASLHQLRGRVGRETGKGFCFLFMTAYSAKSYARLKNLEEIDNGLELAEIDMKYRGQGDIFGTMQHGFKRFKIADLGDLELLEQAKSAAQEIFPQISNYPTLQERLTELGNELIKDN